MKAKSRKRLLISSVAMLLVAMLALGTATYAWFSVNKSVYADGMKVTASAPKGLQVTTVNGYASDAATSTNWASTMSFDNASSTANVAAVSIPWNGNSMHLPANYFYPKTVKDGSSAANAIFNGSNSEKFAEWQTLSTYPTINATQGSDAFGKYTDTTTNTTYLVAYTVGVRSTEDIATTNITCKVELTGTGNVYTKVAVIDNGSTANVTLTGGGQSPTAFTKVLADASTPWDAITADTPAKAAVGTVTAAGTEGGATWTFAGLNGCGENTSVAKYYTFLMWVEGQDADCYDEHPSLSGSLKITFSYN